VRLHRSLSKNYENTNLSFSAKRRISLFQRVETLHFVQGDTKKQFFDTLTGLKAPLEGDIAYGKDFET
jgi:hypothetical protein